ncbi:ABC transporter substrate-binding protein [Natranaerobius thermophilus]|uniref:Periplasmic binding protein n=1 Tax=Natranaerobius thermophilus (strain ATCC BAA-1301 / DSM 18059 / JW/NM-WN-LF) TaxID=457570 RepID=B2A0Q2_NATTJ|nr:ABC transporter substrate-binding protein [Natranaerobius thermophilus]ACB85932.1 periplasmic binding protein [Natranaerobius thermophilus JW/NM-WN-LF]
MKFTRLSLYSILIVIIIMGSGILAACGDEEPTDKQAQETAEQKDGDKKDQEGKEQDQDLAVTVTDHMDREIEFESHPETVVSLMPNLTETLFALDMSDQILGITDFCNYPQEVEDKTRVGDAFDLNVEKIVSLEPDLVVMGGGEMMGEINDKLDEMGIKTLVFDPQDLDEVEEMFLTLGEVFDREEAAENLHEEFKQEREQLQSEVSDIDETQSAVVLLEPESLYTVGEDVFLSEVIELTGVENIASDISGYDEISQEVLLDQDPDVIITTYHDIEELKAMGALSELTAVKEGRVYQGHDDKLSRPGPRVIDGAREVFEEIY